MPIAYSDLTVSGPQGWILTVEGCPYAFATAGTASVAFTGTRPDRLASVPNGGPGDWCTSTVEWIILNGWLATPKAWSERIALVEPELEVGNMTFVIHDDYATSGDASGSLVMTWLSAGQSSLVRTQLAATLTATGLSATVDADVLAAAPFTIWTEREAIRISGKAGNVLTVDTSAPVGRGILGSRPKKHTVDTDSAFNPAVWTTYPWMARRRVVLWTGKLSSAGVMTDPVPMWRGIVSQSPRTSEDGVTWELACDHILQTLGDMYVGQGSEACRMQGYSSGVSVHTGILRVAVAPQSTVTHAFVPERLGYPSLSTTATRTFIDSLEGLCGSAETSLNTALAVATAITCQAHVTASGPTGIKLAITELDTASFESVRIVLDSPATGLLTASGARGATIESWFPEAAQLVGVAGTECTLRMASVANLPTTWGGYGAGTAGRTYQAFALLVSSGERQKIILDPSLVLARSGEPVSQANRTVTAEFGMEPYSFSTPIVDGVYVSAGAYGWFYLLGALPFALTLGIGTNDWVTGFRYGIIGDQVLVGTPQEIDTAASDWNWDRSDRAFERTPALLRRRDWRFDGGLSVRDILVECMRFSGSMLAIRRGALALDVIDKPLRSDVTDAAHTFTSAQLVEGSRPRFQENPEGICNAVDLTIKDQGRTWRWVVSDRTSVGAFGPRRKVEIELHGIRLTPELLMSGARYIGEALYRRVLGLWAGLTRTITMAIADGLGLVDSVYIGDVVTVTEWLAPNDSRGRGWAARKALVIGRDIDPETSEVKFACLAFGSQQYSGFAPCIRASGIAGAVFTASTAYANTSDYSGSDVSGYANATRGTVATDYGVGYFAAGDKVELVERDNIAPRAADSFTIASVDTAAKTVTLTGAPNAAWQAIIAGGGIVEMRYDDYGTAGLQTAQKNWPFVCDRATRQIGGTTDAAYLWVA